MQPSFVPDIDDSDDGSYLSDDEYQLAQAQEEWEESLRQLQQLFSFVLLPLVGKWLGRRWSYWAYARYNRLGLGKAFLFEK
ncbi:hypothetical protein L218DRAFT_992791 [Marasmius fiardii PR-910]|nr:hypothetical protein L218DRAFT_992791 [Marasmius fiardii PR-910]